VILREAKAFKPHVWLNVHSGMYALFSPYDHKAQVGLRRPLLLLVFFGEGGLVWGLGFRSLGV